MKRRIVKYEENDGVKRRRISALLDDTATSAEGVQPIINAYYRDNFNVVDHFNILLSEVEWNYDWRREHFFYLVSCLRFLTVNLVTVILELREVTTRPKVREVVLEIANELMKRK